MIEEAKTPVKHYIERMHDGFYKHFVDIYDENGKPFQIILHHFTKEDSGLPHNHPLDISSYLVEGSYIQEVYTIHKDGTWSMETEEILPGTVNRIEKDSVHRIVHLPKGETWTMVKYGPWIEKSGFFRFNEDKSVDFRYWDEEDFKPYKA